MEENKNKKILYLELGIVFYTPVWIKFPFIRLTCENPVARYVIMDNKNISILEKIKEKTYWFKEDIGKILRKF